MYNYYEKEVINIDIVVTIPKSEYKIDEKEREVLQSKDSVAFWTLSKLPKKLEIGDRVYFVKYGQIDSSMKVIEIKSNSKETCTTTGRVWSGNCQLFLDELIDERLSNQKAKGFQGFRYKWWN